MHVEWPGAKESCTVSRHPPLTETEKKILMAEEALLRSKAKETNPI